MKTVIFIVLGIFYVNFFMLYVLLTGLPALPIMLLAFPKMAIYQDWSHWSCKPYLWYHKHWLNITNKIWKL